MTIFPYLLTLYLTLLITQSFASDYTDLIYKGCAGQKFQDPSGSDSQTLKTLFNSLITQSSKTNFSKTTAGENTQEPIFGLYQCRGDLSSNDCSNCVSQFPKLAKKLCGEVIAVRVQLVGCYMRYEVVGFRQVTATELLYKYCKAGSVPADSGFETRRESAFQEVEDGVVSGGGFYAASYGSVYVMGQCEGDLVGSDCGDCVRTALERVKSECGDSSSGQVYLHMCYVSYSYYPNGVGPDQKTSSPGTGHNTAKTVAIVVGGTAAAGFGVAILLCIKSVTKKKSTKYQYGGYGG